MPLADPEFPWEWEVIKGLILLGGLYLLTLIPYLACWAIVIHWLLRRFNNNDFFDFLGPIEPQDREWLRGLFRNVWPPGALPQQ